MMNTSAGNNTGFAENSLCQRRRCVESVSEKQLNIEIREIEKTWNEECRDAGIVGGINEEKSLYDDSTNWKNEVLKKRYYIIMYCLLPGYYDCIF